MLSFHTKSSHWNEKLALIGKTNFVHEANGIYPKQVNEACPNTNSE